MPNFNFAELIGLQTISYEKQAVFSKTSPFLGKNIIHLSFINNTNKISSGTKIAAGMSRSY
jgi:hypothetical protein